MSPPGLPRKITDITQHSFGEMDAVHTQRKTVKRKPSKPNRDPDARLLSAFVDKKILHAIKIEAAKRNMNMSELVRHVINQALKDKKILPPPRDL